MISFSACFLQKSAGSRQSVPDFTGTWALDKNRSGPGGIAGSSQIYADISLVIEHINPEMKIVRTIKSGDGKESGLTVYIFVK